MSDDIEWTEEPGRVPRYVEVGAPERTPLSELRQKIRAGCAFTTPDGEWEKIDAEVAALEQELALAKSGEEIEQAWFDVADGNCTKAEAEVAALEQERDGWRASYQARVRKHEIAEQDRERLRAAIRDIKAEAENEKTSGKLKRIRKLCDHALTKPEGE